MPFFYNPPDIFHIERASHSNKWVMPVLHSHEAYELYILESGYNNLLIDGKIVRINAGEILPIIPFSMHRSCGNTAHDRTVIYFTDEYLAKYFTPAAKESLLGFYQPCILKPTSETRRIIEELVASLLSFEQPYDHDAIFPILTELLITLGSCSTDELSNALSVNRSLGAILDYINKNYTTIENIAEIANKFFITPQYLCKLFKDGTALTVTEYITKLRIQRACQLLSDTDMSVTDIYLEVGFNSSVYFSRIFKSATGYSPRDFRNKCKK